VIDKDEAGGICLTRGCLREQLGIPSGERHEICRGLHAEQNAIIQAALHGVSTKGSTCYVTHFPCIQCAKMLINAGVVRIVYDQEYRIDENTLEFLRLATAAQAAGGTVSIPLRRALIEEKDKTTWLGKLLNAGKAPQALVPVELILSAKEITFVLANGQGPPGMPVAETADVIAPPERPGCRGSAK
jgi:deoxycytidylate deaminase